MHWSHLISWVGLFCLLSLSMAEKNGCDPNNAKLMERAMQSEDTVESFSLNADDDATMDILQPDASLKDIRCENCGKIKKDKPKFGGYCSPRSSKGYRSSHECSGKNVGGKSYLCVQNGVATCYHNNLAKLRMEGGECFK
ncbi:hypothetical protein FE257_006455 [Aspergillus nanangensis]|uniref:Uncharacterized protein n=1 Tax=Aspergillus nanangensis TaxID=2582783 RepID=A0AAD4CXJ8_ASPNN|nr:hypothetical protein FE257_006455 [Aspergillus nanangensis]